MDSSGGRKTKSGFCACAITFQTQSTVIICILYSTAQVNLFIPSPSHCVTESQSFWFSIKIFSRSALVGGPKNAFHRGQNPLLATVAPTFLWLKSYSETLSNGLRSIRFNMLVKSTHAYDADKATGLETTDRIPTILSIFVPYPSRPTVGPIQFPVQWVPSTLFAWVKRVGREADHLSRPVLKLSTWSYTYTSPCFVIFR